MKSWIKRLFTGTCVWFTVLAVGLMLIRSAMGGFDGAIIDVSRFLLLLPCCLFWAGAGTIYRHTALSGQVRLLAHYLLTILAPFLFLWLPSGTHAGAQNLLAIGLLTVLYALGFGIFLLTRHRFRNIKEED